MGWVTYYVPENEIDRLAECRKIFGREPSWATIIKDALVGEVYYAAMRSTRTGKVWALVVLTNVENYEFGYKDMDETVGPCYYDCPNSILNLLSPTDSDYAKEWRAKCRANKHKRKPSKQKDPQDALRKYLGYEFSSGPYTGEDYKTFQNKYINYLRKLCRENGWELTNVGRNHYQFSAFIRNAQNRFIYFSISDVRFFPDEWFNDILIRRADNENDYHGYSNNRTSLDNLRRSIERLFQCA